MSVEFTWSEHTLTITPSKIERKVVGNQKEVPIRDSNPFYIPLGFTGPEITIGFGFPTSAYGDVANLSTEIRLQVSQDDPSVPELPLNTYWYVTGKTIDRGNGQRSYHSCELKLMRDWSV